MGKLRIEAAEFVHDFLHILLHEFLKEGTFFNQAEFLTNQDKCFDDLCLDLHCTLLFKS